MLTSPFSLILLGILEAGFGAPIETISAKGNYRAISEDKLPKGKEVVLAHGYSQIIDKLVVILFSTICQYSLSGHLYVEVRSFEFGGGSRNQQTPVYSDDATGQA